MLATMLEKGGEMEQELPDMVTNGPKVPRMI